MSGTPPRTSASRRRIAGERRSSRPAADREAGAGAEEQRLVPEGGTGSTAVGAPAAVPDAVVAPDSAPATVATGSPRASSSGGPSWLVVGVLGLVALALVVTAAVLGLVTWSYRDVRHDDAVDEASRTAPAAAERAASTILSYSYRSLSADEKAAARLMTPAYRAKYTRSFTRLVVPNAPKLRAKVAAEVKASGVSHADPDRVDVLVYVNQTTVSTANGGQPQVALNRAMFTMRKVHGDWLVDRITSY